MNILENRVPPKLVPRSIGSVALFMVANEQSKLDRDCYFQIFNTLDVFFASKGALIPEFIEQNFS